MAKTGMDILRDIGAGLTPIVVGVILFNQTALIPMLPVQAHIWLGLGIGLVGGIDLLNRFMK